MHMKRAMLASDDVHTAARFRAALAGLDIAIVECGLIDIASRLAEREVDLVVVDGGRSPDVLVQSVENAVAEGMAVSLLLLVDMEGLASLRLPTRLSADFMLREGTGEEAAARVRGLLWPGEEASTQELIRIDDMTLNLATYQAYRGGVPVDFTYLEYALFTFLVVLELIAVPAFGLLLLGPSLGPALPGLALVLLLADLGIAVIGTLVSAIAVHTRARDLIGPVVGLPLLIPALIATARAMGPLLTLHTSGSPPGRWLAILGLYDLVFALLAYAVFDFLLED